MMEPQSIIFKDDGLIPNSGHPVLLFRGAVDLEEIDPASSMEERFAANHWTNSWRDGIYGFHHYHSTSHEVLGIFRGSVTVRLGGEQGRDFIIEPGDVIVIPAGVGHKNMGASPDLGVGAYPDGRRCDLLRGRPGERPQADQNISAIPTPNEDPLYGPNGPLMRLWVKSRSPEAK
jgi:uncharacterized protein YjlB